MLDAGRCWSAVCATLGCDARRADAVWREVAVAYAEPWRHYHTMQHVAALLALRRENATLFRDSAVVDLAIILHDVVYDPQRTDNEAASAQWARGRLAMLGIAAEKIATVAYLIEMSRHDPATLASVDPSSDLAHFLDLDLSILATEPDVYATYARAIRDEYAVYPDAVYRPGRAKVLRGFLARRSVYCSAHFHAAWEDRARANIAAEIGRLTS